MAVSSVSCSLKPPAPCKEASSARPQPTPSTTAAQWSSSLRRACVAAAACAVVGMADGGAGTVAHARDAVAIASRTAADGGAVVAVDARAGPPRWSDRRQCPAWRANSLENYVPENLPRPSAQRRFNGVTAAGTTKDAAPALAPDAVLPFLALRSGMGCFSL